jgi:uncharacterized RDD family membrane protein YckC
MNTISIQEHRRVGRMVTGFDYLSKDHALQTHWVKRFVAIVIDSLLIWLPLLIFFEILGFGAVVPSLLFGPILFLYALIFEMAIGGTLGKVMMHLKAVSVSGQMNSSQATIRNISKIFGLFLLLDWIIGMLTDTTDPRQKWLDQLARTSVIAIDQPGGT